ncbi:MAG: hypothetical protein WDA06_00925 [Phenylobacterium sp.]
MITLFISYIISICLFFIIFYAIFKGDKHYIIFSALKAMYAAPLIAACLAISVALIITAYFVAISVYPLIFIFNIIVKTKSKVIRYNTCIDLAMRGIDRLDEFIILLLFNNSID